MALTVTELEVFESSCVLAGVKFFSFRLCGTFLNQTFPSRRLQLHFLLEAVDWLWGEVLYHRWFFLTTLFKCWAALHKKFSRFLCVKLTLFNSLSCSHSRMVPTEHCLYVGCMFMIAATGAHMWQLQKQTALLHLITHQSWIKFSRWPPWLFLQQHVDSLSLVFYRHSSVDCQPKMKQRSVMCVQESTSQKLSGSRSLFIYLSYFRLTVNSRTCELLDEN